MKLWRRVEWQFGFILGTALILFFILNEHKLLTLCIGSLLILNYIWLLKGIIKRERELTSTTLLEQHEQWKMIFIQQRHNLLNDFQLVYSYAQLKKYETLQQYIKDVNERYTRDRLITQLKNEKLLLQLLTIQTIPQIDKLYIFIPESFQEERYTQEIERLADLFIRGSNLFMEIIREEVELGQLTIEIDYNEDERSLFLKMGYDGQYNQNKLKTLWAQSCKECPNQINQMDMKCDLGEISLWITIPTKS